MTTHLSSEKEQIRFILSKCQQENDPQRLVDHLQAIKTFYLAFSIQQNTLMYQLKEGQVVDGELEDQIIEECAGCVGETHLVVKELHRFLRKYEDSPDMESISFRVAASRLLHHFEHSLNRIDSFNGKLVGAWSVM